jgi:hypothetical protein
MFTALKKARILAARVEIRRVIKRYKLEVVSVERNGPRFYVARCRHQDKLVVFKICLFTDRVDPRTNAGLRRETITLNYFHSLRNKFFAESTPGVLYSQSTGRTWYIREYLDGQTQNIQHSNFVFKPEFFAPHSIAWIVKFFGGLQQLSRRLPPKLRPLYAKHTLKTNLELIGWRKVPGLIGSADATERIINFLKPYHKTFDNNQTVITHYEPYASHFFRHGPSGFYMIDWENVDCGTPAHDVSVIWHRAFLHPKWQKDLWREFYKATPYPKQFEELFKVEIVLQCIHNLDYFNRTTIPTERKIKRQAIAFYRRAINLVLAGQFNKLVK